MISKKGFCVCKEFWSNFVNQTNHLQTRSCSQPFLSSFYCFFSSLVFFLYHHLVLDHLPRNFYLKQKARETGCSSSISATVRPDSLSADSKQSNNMHPRISSAWNSVYHWCVEFSCVTTTTTTCLHCQLTWYIARLSGATRFMSRILIWKLLQKSESRTSLKQVRNV